MERPNLHHLTDMALAVKANELGRRDALAAPKRDTRPAFPDNAMRPCIYYIDEWTYKEYRARQWDLFDEIYHAAWYEVKSLEMLESCLR